MTGLALRCLLAFAALVGLAAPSSAMPMVSAPTVEASTMTDDCMEMMADHKDPPAAPCDGSFKCMVMMGCLSVNLVAEFGGSSAMARIETPQEYWPAIAILRGASLAPEPDPPTTSA